MMCCKFLPHQEHLRNVSQWNDRDLRTSDRSIRRHAEAIAARPHRIQRAGVNPHLNVLRRMIGFRVEFAVAAMAEASCRAALSYCRLKVHRTRVHPSDSTLKKSQEKRDQKSVTKKRHRQRNVWPF